MSRNKVSELIRASKTDPLSAFQLSVLQRPSDSGHDSDGYFHPSSIGSYCKRKLVFPYILDAKGKQIYPPKKNDSSRLLEIYENGTFGHIRKQLGMIYAGLILQRRVLKKSDREYMDELYQDYWDEPAAVITDLWNFVKKYFCIEVEMEDEEDGVRGHCDGIILFNKKIWVWEFKTWNSFAYNALSTAELEHRLQATTYLRYLIRTHKGKKFYDSEGNVYRLKNLEGCRFWYENKNDQNTKQFEFKREPELEEKIIKLVRSAKKFRLANKLPKQLFHNKNSKPCTWCKFSDYCYGGV